MQTKFKQEDRELKLKFEHLTQSVSELKVLAHNQPPMTFAYSDSSIGQPSGNATRNTLSKGNTSSSSLVQYTESPSMKRRSRASVTPPKVSNSQISPRTEPKRVLPSIPSPLSTPPQNKRQTFQTTPPLPKREEPQKYPERVQQATPPQPKKEPEKTVEESPSEEPLATLGMDSINFSFKREEEDESLADDIFAALAKKGFM